MLDSEYEQVYDIFTEISTQMNNKNYEPAIAIYLISKESWKYDEIMLALIIIIEILPPLRGVQELIDKTSLKNILVQESNPAG